VDEEAKPSSFRGMITKVANSQQKKKEKETVGSPLKKSIILDSYADFGMMLT